VLLVTAALAAFFATEAVKLAALLHVRPLEAWVKMLVAALVATGVVLLGAGFNERAVGLALGASGLAALAQRLHRLLGALGDAQRVQVMSAVRRR
jgi:hypothetical protein